MFERNEKKDAELAPELVALERQLAGLDVAPLHVDRDRLMFEAGHAARYAERAIAATQRVAGAPRWFWPSAAAMMTAACVALVAMLILRDNSALVAQQHVKPQAVKSPGIETPTAEDRRDVDRLASGAGPAIWTIRPSGGYLEKRYVALTRGVGELRSEGDGGVSFEPSDSTEPATARELLREFVPSRALPNHSNS